jgi:hypothetical protein
MLEEPDIQKGLSIGLLRVCCEDLIADNSSIDSCVREPGDELES